MRSWHFLHGVVAHFFNPSTCGAETGRPPRDQDQQGLQALQAILGYTMGCHLKKKDCIVWAISIWLLVLLAVSGVGSLSRHGSQAKTDIGWPIPQFLSHLYPSASLGKTNCRSKVSWLGWSPIASIEILPGYYRRWLAQAPISPLLVFLARITLVDS